MILMYAVITLLLVMIELSYFRIARSHNIVSPRSKRSSHSGIGIQGGGIIFLAGAGLYRFLFSEYAHYDFAFAGLAIVGIVSFIDDVHPLSIKIRLIAQFLAVLLMFAQFGVLGVSDWWFVGIALVGCVGILNAYNFMDGINGITSGYSLAVLMPLIYLNYSYDFISMPYLYITGISLLIFSFFNFRKRALCFAGDVGSISIAFILLFALGNLVLTTGEYYYIGFLALYGVDAVLTICHRIMLRENLGEAHRKHAYQLMANELKLPHIVVSAAYMAVQILISAGLIFLPVNHYVYLAVVVGILAVGYILFMKKYYRLHADYLDKHCR